jgi:imidazolonepropionase-like amidohydrolase
MTPAQALVASTSSAAELLGVADELGAIEVGKLADIVVVDGDPFQFDDLARRIRAVYQAGRRVSD